MKVDIIVVYIERYERGHEADFVPPITGIHHGYNVAFAPARMSPAELVAAHRALWREAFSVTYSLKRVLRALFRLRPGAFLMCAMMNLFYCLKALHPRTARFIENVDVRRSCGR